MSSSAPDFPNRRCSICGFVHAGETPPAHCPECGALAAMFEPSAEEPHGIAHNPFQPHDRSDRDASIVGPGDTGCIDSD